jgi:D-serine deaminase-like pyridoxal phosphate-dependent protein
VRAVPLRLDRILATPVTGDTTGAPAGADTTIGAVGEQGWTLDDLTPPAVTLRRSAIAHNLDVMDRWVASRGVALFPHGKTTMAPQLWERQLDGGAGGITAATPTQVRAMRSAGVARVLLANEPVDRASIAWLARATEDPGFEVMCWVDAVDGVEVLVGALRDAASTGPLPVLVELGHTDGRTGARSVDAAVGVAAAVDRAPSLTLAGVAGYEGTLGHDRSPEMLAAVDRFLDDIGAVADRIEGLVDGPATVSAGGSLFFDRVVERLQGRAIVLRAGCTITHDHGVYERGSPLADRDGPRFWPAIEAWGSVVSRPEPSVAVIGLGKRDVPSDVDPPIPLRTRDGRALTDVTVRRLMDQHAICEVSAELELAVGELVAFGISHPCTAFDRRRVLFELDDDDRVVGAIGTLF